MNAQLPPFYKNVVPLSKEKHKDLHLESVAGFSFASNTSSIFVTASEFGHASREYPIVFGRNDRGRVFPAVLLGLQKNQNLFLSQDGKWSAEYIPAYARRYPFILATPDNQLSQLMVCIDRDYPGFNTNKQGEALFDDSGKETGFLSRAIGFLKDYQRLVKITEAFCRTLDRLELLQPMRATVELTSGENSTVAGFMCVSRPNLKTLTSETLTEIFKSDELELIYLHLNSLDNLDRLSRKLSVENSAP